MTTTMEMTIEDGATTPSKLVSCRTVQEEESDAEEIGEAIGVVVAGTQSVRPLLAMAHAVYALSGGGNIQDVEEIEREFVVAACALIVNWAAKDAELIASLEKHRREMN
jgi:hypothetical protein